MTISFAPRRRWRIEEPYQRFESWEAYNMPPDDDEEEDDEDEQAAV